MIAPSRAAAYRRFYLYSLLSVAVIGIAVAAAVLLHLGIQALGFGERPLPAEPSRNISLAIALLAIAVPVGGVHLWLIRRSFTDPAERATGIRHQYLNLWVAFALLLVLFMGQAACTALTFQDGADVTIQLSVIAVAAVVATIAAWWISRTPPESPRPRIRAAIVVMLVAMAVAAFALAGAASSAAALFSPQSVSQFSFGGLPLTFEQVQQRQLRASLLTAGVALTIWSVAFVWQRPWRDSRDRLGYALLGYGLGTLALVVGGAFGIAGAIRFGRDQNEAGAFTATWPFIAAGALLVATHLTLLLADRGRNGHPAVTTTRLSLAFPALVGLGLMVGGLGVAWHAGLERDDVTARRLTDELIQGVVLLGVGAAAYLASWLAFDRRTTAASAVRRFYLFTVVCLALVAGLLSAVVGLYEALTAASGAGDPFAGRTALTWLMPAAALAVIFTAHLRLLLADQRATRAVETAVPADPLIVLLDAVRAGRVSAEQAAATIRGGLS